MLFAVSAGFFLFDRATPEDARFRRAQVAQQNGWWWAPCTTCTGGQILNANLVALLDGMLRINPADRMTLDAVCNSQWVSAVGAAVFAHDNVMPLAPALCGCARSLAGRAFAALRCWLVRCPSPLARRTKNLSSARIGLVGRECWPHGPSSSRRAGV